MKKLLLGGAVGLMALSSLTSAPKQPEIEYNPPITYFDNNGYDVNDRSNPPTFEDNPETTNNETNDQPTGYYGTETVEACNESSGNCYELDADFDGEMVTTIYFPKGGNLDFDDGYCEDSTCYGTSEEGDEWYFNLN